MNLRLTDNEAAYVRRFCYEVASNQFGPGSIFDRCGNHCHDLEILAAETNIQGDALEDYLDHKAAPPMVEFPWQSFEALHHRAEELRGLVPS
jgi:hypothetical protein